MAARDPRRNQEIGWIKARQKSIGMPDDEYRAMLAGQTGKASAALLTWQERKKVLAYMDQQYPMTAPAQGQQPGQQHKPLAASKQPMERKIGALLGQLGEGWGYVYGRLQSNAAPGIDAFEMLTVEQLGKIASSLERTLRYRARKKEK